jgi:hypothetical protein
VTTLTTSYSTVGASQPVTDWGDDLQRGGSEVQPHDDENATDRTSELRTRRDEHLSAGDDEDTRDTEQEECPDYVVERILHSISNESEEGSVVDAGSHTTVALRCGSAVVRVIAPSAI